MNGPGSGTRRVFGALGIEADDGADYGDVFAWEPAILAMQKRGWETHIHVHQWE